MKKQERYLRNQEKIKSRAIYAIFQEQKEGFCIMLEEESKSFRIEVKKGEGDIVKKFVEKTKYEIPNYLVKVLPAIMIEGAKIPIKRYKDLLPEGYALVFDVDTAPAAVYLQNMTDLMLSQKKGSISRTTKNELLNILEKGIADGKSYGAIAKQIREVDPFVFSKARSKTIATNELGRAYGWANFEPGQVLTDEGYILVKFWQTSEDDKVRPTHMENQAADKVPFADEFPGTGDLYAPSSIDINCRCTSTHEIVGIADGKGIRHIHRGTTGVEIKKIFDFIKKRV
jgi:hypothetical protein